MLSLTEKSAASAPEIEYDIDNNPTSHEEGHGFGTNSIKWFAKRNKLSLNYKITEDTFIINVLFKENINKKNKLVTPN